MAYRRPNRNDIFHFSAAFLAALLNSGSPDITVTSTTSPPLLTTALRGSRSKGCRLPGKTSVRVAWESMKTAFFPLLIFLCAITGCATRGGLYRVQVPGAVVTARTVPTATVKIKSAPTFLTWPTISVVFENGEKFNGGLFPTSVSSARKGVQYSQSALPPHPNLADDWDAIYGKGFFQSNYGKPRPRGAGPFYDGLFFQAILKGSQGTVLQIEVGGQTSCTPNDADSKYPGGETCTWDFNGTGVAADNKGNVYKYLDRYLMAHPGETSD